MSISRSATVAAAWSKAYANHSKNRNRSKRRKNYMAVFSRRRRGLRSAARDVKFQTVFMLYTRYFLARLPRIFWSALLPAYLLITLCVSSQAQQPSNTEKKVENPIGAAEDE